MPRSAATRRPGRPAKAEGLHTREALLDAALEAFAAKGFAATSIRELAEAVGVRESVIYVHFDSKQAIFDTLMAQSGLLELGELGVDLSPLAELGPAAALPDLARRIVDAFDQPRARRFSSVMMREGLLGKAAGGKSLTDAIAAVQRQLHPLFEVWLATGRLRSEFTAEQLVWELLAPLANVRFVYLNAQSTEEERALGRELAERHVSFFVTTTAPPSSATDYRRSNP
ncbi:TetR/AcrR family transcriptional regulator [Micromonospora arborensis]|uniref:TetR/AcrR family transcriptional regulator n=1 Tax=Micromonospora arborensis TaxID=2116518 RepID=A0A318P4G0_9ACTN|nr:TetR/AcrR family transcriptional regulator [Micromonospora arborensis]PYC71604.1 TetR/AcrR family transcriptional regulator [Micromonospora arborensis]